MQEPYLSESQQIALFHAVGRRIASIVTGTRGVRIAEQVPDIAEVPLLGAFVSLKRNGELRSCMGTMSDQMPLAAAVEQAAVHAAKDDPRFPPITTAELFELEMEIWILWGMKRVAARGADRINAVEIGRHGVQISRGGNRGLLLPGVAIEHQMDAQAFWEAVCRKAGLPTDAWLDDRSLLHTFEGRAIRGPFSAVEIDNKKTTDEMIHAIRFQREPRVSGPSLADIEQLREACVKTFQGMAEGATPSSYFPGLYDSTISGIALSFQIPERPPIVCSKISIRPDVRLQSSMLELLKVLARQVERFGFTWHEVLNARFDLCVTWDPTIHGNANRYDLSTVDTAYRSLMISAPEGWISQFDPTRDAEEILKQSAEFLELKDKDLGEVISFETVSTYRPCLITNLSKPDRGPEIRPPAVAGSFYPANVNEMKAELDRMFRDAPKTGKACSAVMIPHAGWFYSGRLAAQTLASVEIPKQVIIFAPKHRASGADWAVAPNRVWALPGRNIESDLDLAEAMTRAVDYLEFDAASHAQEHSIEVQLPILARLAPQTKIVGAVLGMSSWPAIHQGAKQFAGFLATLPELPLFVISSDMNHYASDEITRKIDRLALDAIRDAVKTGNPEQAFDTVLQNQISMCGIVPTVFVMETLKQLNRLHSVEEVGYSTSAEASGDTDRVVGYAGLLFR